MATLGAVTLENIQTISHRKQGSVLTLPIPLEDSDKTEIFDLGGNQELFDITGFFESTSVAATKTKVDSLFALMNASQANIDLITDQTGTIPVKVAGLQITWDITDTPTSVIANYAVSLIRSGGV